MRILSLAALLLTPYYTFAASNAGFEGLNTLIRSFADGVVRSTGYMMFTLAVVAFFWGIVQFIWSARQGSDGKENTKGKQFMLWGLIALFVMFSVWGIIKFAQGVFKIQGDNTIIVPDLNFKSSGAGVGSGGSVTTCDPRDIGSDGKCYNDSSSCAVVGCTITSPTRSAPAGASPASPSTGGAGGTNPAAKPAASSGGGGGAGPTSRSSSGGTGSSAPVSSGGSAGRTTTAKPFTANNNLANKLGLFGEETSLGISGSRTTGASANNRTAASPATSKQTAPATGLVASFNNTINGVTNTVKNVWSSLTGGASTQTKLIQETDGWKYYTDGTSIGPDGTYYFQGKAVTGPEGKGTPTENGDSCGEGFSYDAESSGCISICGSGFSYDNESRGCVSTGEREGDTPSGADIVYDYQSCLGTGLFSESDCRDAWTPLPEGDGTSYGTGDEDVSASTDYQYDH